MSDYQNLKEIVDSALKDNKNLKASDAWPAVLTLDEIFSVGAAYQELPSDVDHGTTYSLNSLRHRSQEFGSADVLFSGCSITYGWALNLEQTWGHKVAQEFGWKYDLMAFPGASTPKIVRKILRYLATYENKPKYIFCLFPPSNRVDSYASDYLTNPGYILENTLEIRDETLKTVATYRAADERVKDNKILTIAHNEQTCLDAIATLETACKLAGVVLIWDTWDASGHSNLSSIYSKFYKNYLGSNLDGQEFFDDKTYKCHSELSQGKYFHSAHDGEHYGAHYHAHVAEAFISKIKKLEERDSNVS